MFSCLQQRLFKFNDNTNCYKTSTISKKPLVIKLITSLYNCLFRSCLRRKESLSLLNYFQCHCFLLLHQKSLVQYSSQGIQTRESKKLQPLIQLLCLLLQFLSAKTLMLHRKTNSILIYHFIITKVRKSARVLYMHRN